MTRKVIENTHRSYNGGYGIYWKLVFLQLPKQITLLYPTIKQQYAAQIEAAGGWKFTLHLKAIVVTAEALAGVVLRLPWWLFIKPLGSILYYTKKKYDVTVEDNVIVSYSRVLTVYLFRFIPVYFGTSKKPKEKDLEILFKKEASDITFAPRKANYDRLWS